MQANKSSMKSLTKTMATGGAILLFLLLMSALCSWINYGGYWLIVDKNDPQDVATVFTLSLMQNRERSMKPLVTTERHPQLDSWLATHQAVKCPFPLDGDTYWLGGIERSYDDKSNVYIYDSVVNLPCSSSFYLLAVKDIVLEQTEQGWQIVSWGEVCEAWGREQNDCFP
jgi:hypothetical protein